jgi:dual specificity phosphatase 12
MLTPYLIVMRSLKIQYSAALSLAQESRPLICPNEGFERQLQAWEQCDFDVYASCGDTAEKEEKPAYREWKNERDDLFRAGEEAVNKARALGIANMAARFAKKRQEALGQPNSYTS